MGNKQRAAFAGVRLRELMCFLGDCAMLNLTVHVVCRGIIKASVGCEDAPVCNSLRPAEGLG